MCQTINSPLKRWYDRGIYTTKLLVVVSLFASLPADAQNEIDFTNKVSFSKTGTMNGIRLVTLMPVPVTNEYQEISMLQANCGNFINLDATNMVLFFDGSFEGSTFDVLVI